MIFEHQNYKTFLKTTLAEKIAKNPSYSLRSFAQQLGVSHAALSQVFKGEKNFSFERAMDIATKLNLKDKEREYFCLLVQYEAAKKIEVRSEIRERLNRLRPVGEVQDLNLDIFKVISDWYHFAILALIRLDKPLPPEFIADQLGISSIEAEAAIERLDRLNLIEKLGDHRYIRTKNRILAQSDTSNSALNKFNKQMLMKSLESIEEQNSEERITGSETFILSPEKFSEAKRLTYEYLDKFDELSADGRKGEEGEVYHVHVNCFKLTKKQFRRKSYEKN
ncbi:MAG: TIGR02147 family protein [Bacteriovoracaceae bacterium]